MQRICNFLAKLKTTKRQRHSVDYFRKYTISDRTVLLEDKKSTDLKAKTLEERENIKKQAHDLERLQVLKECKPKLDRIDNRIFFEMTGRRLNPEQDWPEKDES